MGDATIACLSLTVIPVMGVFWTACESEDLGKEEESPNNNEEGNYLRRGFHSCFAPPQEISYTDMCVGISACSPEGLFCLTLDGFDDDDDDVVDENNTGILASNDVYR